MNGRLKLHGLAERAEQRRRKRRASHASGLADTRFPGRKEALEFLRSLPTKTLVAVHKAAIQFHEQQNQ